MKNRLVLIYMALLGLTFSAGAREVADLSLEITVNKKGPAAKQEAFDQATEEAARRYTEEILGGTKMAQWWPQIRQKLIKNSTRYVLFIKGGTPVEAGETTKIPFQMRVSPDGLESLLREMGLFGASTVRLLPLVAVSESHGSSYAWWAENTQNQAASLAQDFFKKIYPHLNAHFKGKSIYVLDAMVPSMRMGVPATYRSEGLRREDQALLAQYLKADVVLTGRVDIARVRSDSPEHVIKYSLGLWQPKNGRVLAEVNRSEVAANDTPKVLNAVIDQADKRVFSELASKLAEVASGGNLNLSTLRISVSGPLNYRQSSEFRRQLGDLRDIRLLKERLSSANRTVYEAETPVSGQDLAKTLQKARFPGFMVSVEATQDNSLDLVVRATSAQ